MAEPTKTFDMGCPHMRMGEEPCIACGGKRESNTKDPAKKVAKSLGRAFSTGWSIVKNNPHLPKEGSLDGVLSSSGRPDVVPSNNAGMPRDPDLLERLKRMQAAKEAKR